MYQLFRSLAYIHSLGICHRDIKPQNLLLDPKTGVLKLCDFGSAKHLVRGEPNVSYICSRYYRAPELIFGAIDYTTKIGEFILYVCVSVYKGFIAYSHCWEGYLRISWWLVGNLFRFLKLRRARKFTWKENLRIRYVLWLKKVLVIINLTKESWVILRVVEFYKWANNYFLLDFACGFARIHFPGYKVPFVGSTLYFSFMPSLFNIFAPKQNS